MLFVSLRVIRPKVREMSNNEKIDVYRTLTVIAELLAEGKGAEKSPFILAASDGTDKFTAITSGDKKDMKELCRNILSGVIEKLSEVCDEEEIADFTTDVVRVLLPGAAASEDWYYEENPEYESGSDTDDDIFDDELSLYDDYYSCYYDDDTDDLDEVVKKHQVPISQSMKVLEILISQGTVTDVDGKEYEIAFSCKSSDGSCIYLVFTDNEVIDDGLILLAAKLFPGISETTLFPLTEWEDVAIRLEQIKRSMYGEEAV